MCSMKEKFLIHMKEKTPWGEKIMKVVFGDLTKGQKKSNHRSLYFLFFFLIIVIHECQNSIVVVIISIKNKIDFVL